MALDTQVGTFALNTSTGEQIIPCDFEAKVIFFYPTIQTADGIAVDFSGNFGVATQDLEQFAVSTTDENGVPTMDSTRRITITDCMIVMDAGETASITYRASLTAIGDASFTINLSTAPGSAFRVGFLALGGSDIESTKIDQFNTPGSATQISETGVGFEPKFLLTSFTANSIPSNANALRWGMGAAISLLDSVAFGTSSGNGIATSNTRSSQESEVLFHLFSTTGTINQSAYLVSFDSDGFTLDFIDSTAVNGVAYLAISGPIRMAIGTLNSQTSTGEFPVTGIGFEGEAGMFWSWNRVADPLSKSGLELSLGMVDDEGNQFAAGGISEHGVGTSNTDHWSDDGLVYQNYNNAQSQQGAISFTLWDSDGFTLNQTDADPAANEILYMIFGSTPPASSVTIIPDQNPCND